MKHKKIKLKTIVFSFTALILAGLVFAKITSPASAEWFNDSWAYRIPITFGNSGSAVSNQKVNLALTTNTSPLNKLQSSCADARFTDANGHLLQYYQADSCQAATTNYWVLMPNIVSGSNLIYFYYGNSTAAAGSVSAQFSQPTFSPTTGQSNGSESSSPAPVAFWSMDQGHDQIVNDSTTNVLNATLGATSSVDTDDPSWQTNDLCLSGECLKFDGSNDYINAGSTAKLQPTAITVALWVRNADTNVTDFHGLVSNFDSGNGNGYILARGNNSSCTNKAVWYVNVSNASNLCSTTSINDDSWHYIVASYATGEGQRIYIDGRLEAINTNATGSIPYSGGINFVVGGYSDLSAGYFYKGFIDEVKVYPFSLTAAQIKSNYASRGAAKGSSAVLGTTTTSALNKSLVGYWKMDESTGDPADSSGNNISLPNNNVPPAAFVTGKFGNSLSFNGSQFVGGVTSSVLNITGDLTLSSWIYPTAVTAATQYDIITRWDKYPTDQLSYNLAQYGTEFRFYLNSDSNYLQTSGANLAVDTWYQVTAVYHASTATSTIFLNGQPLNSTINGVIPASINSNSARFELGVNFETGGPASFLYEGRLDEVRVYNRALSPAEVSQLYNFAPGPIGYWKMDDNTGTSAADSSGNGSSGSFTGSPRWVVGKYGSGLQTSGTGQYITATLASTPGYSNSVEVWIYPTTSIASKTILTNLTTDSSSRPVYGSCTGTAISLSTWTHVVAISTDSTHCTIYQNGLITASSTTTGVNINSTTFVISANANGFIGTIDDVKIYNYVRSQSQTIQDMNSNRPSAANNSMLGHWDFNEGNLTTAHNSGNGGSTMNGALSGSPLPTWTNSGKFGKGLYFNGTSAYLDVSGIASSVASGDYSVSLWFTPAVTYDSSLAVDKYLLSLGDANSYNDFHLVFGAGDGRLRFQSFDSGNGQQEVYSTQTSWAAGVWHHVTITFNSTTGEKLYIDGVLVGQNSAYTTRGSPNSTLIYIAYNGGYQTYFNGTVDELKIYNYSLSAQDIILDYNNGASSAFGSTGTDSSGSANNSSSRSYCVPGSPDACSSPVGEWKFDENNGASTSDSATNLTTTVTGAPSWAAGKLGSALRFDGSSQSVSATLSSDPGYTNTIELWIYPTSSVASKTLVTASQLTTDSSSRPTYGSCVGTALPLNQWTHLTAVSTSSSSCSLYQNGLLTSTNSTGVTFGTSVNIAASSFSGLIDNVTIFNYARNSAQISWDYNRGAPLIKYDFDECQGNTVYDSAVKSDRSATTYNGTITSDRTIGTCNTASTMWGDAATGKFNSALSFDGTGDSLSTSSTINLSTTTQISVSFWLKWTSYANDDHLALETSSNFNTNVSAFIVDPNSSSSGGGYFEVATHNTGYRSEIFTRPSAGAWHHYVIFIDGSTTANDIRVFVDGLEKTTTVLASNTNTINFGNYNWYLMSRAGSSLFGAGQMDDFRVYAYFLTPAQIKTVYNYGSAVRFGP